LQGYVLLVIEDEGLGFAPPSFEQLFTRYASAGTGQREPLNHGLGLYYCHHVLQAHGGQLWVETTEGQGSAVVMAWPQTAKVMLAAKQGATHDRRRS
jgi:signal transduction histidine kinase